MGRGVGKRVWSLPAWGAVHGGEEARRDQRTAGKGGKCESSLKV